MDQWVILAEQRIGKLDLQNQTVAINQRFSFVKPPGIDRQHGACRASQLDQVRGTVMLQDFLIAQSSVFEQCRRFTTGFRTDS